MYFFDAAYAPDAVKAAQMSKDNGSAGWAVYVGGSRNGGVGWTPKLVLNMATYGVENFLPIWVGPQILPAQNINDAGLLTRASGELDAQNAVREVKYFGFSQTSAIAIDIEGSTVAGAVGGATQYVAGFCDTLRSLSHHPSVVYCPASAIEALPGATYYWAADWMQSDPPDIDFLRRGSSSPNIILWQYWGDTVCGGVSVDKSITVMETWAPSLFQYPALLPPITQDDYTAAHWVAKVNQMTGNIPVRQCRAVQKAVTAFITGKKP